MKYLGKISNTEDLVTKEYIDNIASTKQDALISGTNIKTINDQSILGEGNIEIEGGGGTVTSVTATDGLTGGTITGEGTIGLEEKAPSANLTGLEIDKYGRVVDSVYEFALKVEANGGNVGFLYSPVFELSEEEAASTATIKEKAAEANKYGANYWLAYVYTGDEKTFSKLIIYYNQGETDIITSLRTISSLSEIATSGELGSFEMYWYERLKIYILTSLRGAGVTGDVYLLETSSPIYSLSSTLYNINTSTGVEPRGCKTIYKYDISEADSVEEEEALLYDSTNNKMYLYRPFDKIRTKDEYSFKGSITSIRDLTESYSGQRVYYRFSNYVRATSEADVIYACYLFSDGGASPIYTLYAVIEKTPRAINNPTITITQNGETKGKFTLNQSDDLTIDLSAGGTTVTKELNDYGVTVSITDN